MSLGQSEGDIIITSIRVLSSCQSLPETGSCGGAPGLGLNVPGNVHLGNSRRRRAHSLRLTSKISIKSSNPERTAYPTGVVGSGDT